MRIRTFLLFFAVGCANVDDVNGVNSDDVTVSESTAALQNSSASCRRYSADGRAYSLKLSALGLTVLPPLPDTNVANPTALVKLAVNLPLDLPLPISLSLHDTLFSDSNDASYDSFCASDTAISTTNQLTLAVGSYVALSATTLRAQANSSVSSDGVTVNSEGSLIQNLIVNGHTVLDIDSPLTIPITLLGIPLAEVRLLESIPGYNNCDATATLQVNALHVIVLGGLIDLIVGHAETGGIRNNNCCS